MKWRDFDKGARRIVLKLHLEGCNSPRACRDLAFSHRLLLAGEYSPPRAYVTSGGSSSRP